MHASSHAFEQQILRHRAELIGFIRSKVSDPDLAEDILQDSLLKALRAAPESHDETKLVSWFYTIVRNAITDAYRRHAAAARRLEQLAPEMEEAETPEDEAVLCGCFQSLLPTMKPEYAALIRRMELGGEDPAAVAAELGVTRDNLKVRRHRARQQLRQRLEETCRSCAVHGCIDCTCGKAS